MGVNEITLYNSNSLNAYLREIKKYPRLTEQEERECVHRFNTLGCIKSAHTLVTSNLRFVVHIARQYKSYNVPILDLIQAGNIGLMKAVKPFKLDSGARFVTYAVTWIRAEMLQLIVSVCNMTKFITTKPMRKLFFNKSTVYNENNEPNDIAEISTKLNVPQKDVQLFIEYNQHSKPLDDVDLPVDIVDPRCDVDNLIDQEYQDYMYQRVDQCLTQLSDRDRDIIKGRFLSTDKVILQDFASKYNISRERVRQIEKEALDKIRIMLEEDISNVKF